MDPAQPDTAHRGLRSPGSASGAHKQNRVSHDSATGHRSLPFDFSPIANAIATAKSFTQAFTHHSSFSLLSPNPSSPTMTARGIGLLVASSSSGLPSDQLSMFPPNLPLVSALLAISLAQFLKLFTTWYKEKRWDSKRMLGSGGMPSSHSAGVSALAMTIGLQEGTGGSAFALAAVMACVVMYDASGVRLHAGRQAQLLNQIVCELPPEHPASNCKPLRDSLGHTPLQVVAGAILGCMVAYVMEVYGR